MTRVFPRSTSTGQMPQACETQTTPATHGTSERGMAHLPSRIRMQRVNDRLPGSGDDRPIRHDLVNQIRAQILAGEYDSAAKLEAAAERLSNTLDLLV